MPLLGKRKYINEQIEKILNKLEEKGYNVTHIKNKWYNNSSDDYTLTSETNEEILSSGSILPYRKKVNEVLKMIEDLINQKDTSTTEYSQIPMTYDNSTNIKEILRNAILSNNNDNKSNINQYDFMN